MRSLKATLRLMMILPVDSCQSLQVSWECDGEGPRYMHRSVFASNLALFGFSMYAIVSQPNVRRQVRFGCFPVVSS